MAVSQRQAATVLGAATFAGVVLLPRLLLLALVGVLYLAAWPVFRRAGAKPHRHAYTAAAVGVAGVAGSVVIEQFPLLLIGIPAAIGAYIATNAVLVMLAITLAGHRDAWQMFRRRNFYTVLLTTLSLGAAIGLAMQWHLAAGLAGVPVLVGLHRRAGEATVEETGALVDDVWDREAWLVLADEESRTRNSYSVLLFDLDDAKDMSLVLTLSREWFGGDAVGRYADDQIVVLLARQVVSAANALGVRFGLALADLGVAAGVGAADSLHRPLHDVLALAECEALICRSVELDGDDVPGLV